MRFLKRKKTNPVDLSADGHNNPEDPAADGVNIAEDLAGDSSSDTDEARFLEKNEIFNCLNKFLDTCVNALFSLPIVFLVHCLPCPLSSLSIVFLSIVSQEELKYLLSSE